MSGPYSTERLERVIGFIFQTMPIILKDVSFDYVSTRGDRVPALGHLNISFEHDAISTIVGPSGCGKSTILSLVIGLLAPSKGAVIISLPTNSSEVQFGISFQNPALLGWRTLKENVMLPAVLHPNQGISEERTDEILGLMGLSSFQHKYPHELSGGMQVRASLARAMILRPPVILLDEPFGALDEKTTIDLMDLIARVNTDFGIGFIVVTHNVLQAVYLSDYVFTLTSRPAHLIQAYLIPTPRPRGLVSLADPSVLNLVGQIRQDLGVLDA